MVRSLSPTLFVHDARQLLVKHSKHLSPLAVFPSCLMNLTRQLATWVMLISRCRPNLRFSCSRNILFVVYLLLVIVFRSVAMECVVRLAESVSKISRKNKRCSKVILFTTWILTRAASEKYLGQNFCAIKAARIGGSAIRLRVWNRPSFIRSLFSQINFIFRCRERQTTRSLCVLFLVYAKILFKSNEEIRRT